MNQPVRQIVEDKSLETKRSSFGVQYSLGYNVFQRHRVSVTKWPNIRCWIFVSFFVFFIFTQFSDDFLPNPMRVFSASSLLSKSVISIHSPLSQGEISTDLVPHFSYRDTVPKLQRHFLILERSYRDTIYGIMINQCIISCPGNLLLNSFIRTQKYF